MAMEIDMTPTFYRKAGLPSELQKEPDFTLRGEVQGIRDMITKGAYQHSVIVFCGLKPGKTVSAAALLRDWISFKKTDVGSVLPGFFLPIHQLCYQNRSVDRFNRDEALQEVIRSACSTDFLIMDGVFAYLTQNDDLLLQSIYDARQHSGKTTVVTTSVENPMDCSGSILYRLERDSKIKVVF